MHLSNDTVLLLMWSRWINVMVDSPAEQAAPGWRLAGCLKITSAKLPLRSIYKKPTNGRQSAVAMMSPPSLPYWGVMK